MGNRGKSSAHAINELGDLAQQVAALQTDLTHTRLILQALCRLLRDKAGICDDDVVNMVNTIEKDLAEHPREADKCPSCSRALQLRSKACIYCGTLVTTRRLF